MAIYSLLSRFAKAQVVDESKSAPFEYHLSIGGSMAAAPAT
jgi:hypothetical protein